MPITLHTAADASELREGEQHRKEDNGRSFWAFYQRAPCATERGTFIARPLCMQCILHPMLFPFLPASFSVHENTYTVPRTENKQTNNQKEKLFTADVYTSPGSVNDAHITQRAFLSPL